MQRHLGAGALADRRRLAALGERAAHDDDGAFGSGDSLASLKWWTCPLCKGLYSAIMPTVVTFASRPILGYLTIRVPESGSFLPVFCRFLVFNLCIS